VTYPPPGDLSDFDQYRCTEVDTDGRRCQLVAGHDGQHMLQRGGVRVAWPDDTEPHPRPPSHVTFLRDEDDA
jgi:hypothetical protein